MQFLDTQDRLFPLTLVNLPVRMFSFSFNSLKYPPFCDFRVHHTKYTVNKLKYHILHNKEDIVLSNVLDIYK